MLRAADGSFRTAPRDRRDVSFVWSADLAGQGWGINPDLGGYRIFAAMGAVDPDFYLCSGDHIYADNPLTETVPLPGGRMWRNIVTPAKTKVAETLDEFRGQFAYNLLDETCARSPPTSRSSTSGTTTRSTTTGSRGRSWPTRATPRGASTCWPPGPARRSSSGCRSAAPPTHSTARSPTARCSTSSCSTCGRYKDPNGTDVYADPQPGLLGARQREWLKRDLARSRRPGR